MFKLAKDSAVKSRTQAINQLKAVLVSTDPALRESLSGLPTTKLIRRCAALDTATGVPTDTTSAAAWTLRLLAHRSIGLTAEIGELQARITKAVNTSTPRLLEPKRRRARQRRRAAHRRRDNPHGSTAKHPSPHCAAPARSRPPPARPSGAASTKAATGRPTPPFTASPCPASAGIPAPATTSTDASPKANPSRSAPLPQALHRSRALPDHHPVPTKPNHGPLSRLTSIGPSGRSADTSGPPRR
jgi:hypothetical protein